MKPFDFDIPKLYGGNNTKLTIGVFCSSSQFIEEKYKIQAALLGELLAKNQYDLIHGGGKVGLWVF